MTGSPPSIDDSYKPSILYRDAFSTSTQDHLMTGKKQKLRHGRSRKEEKTPFLETSVTFARFPIVSSYNWEPNFSQVDVIQMVEIAVSVPRISNDR
jgi:hypothetical protein